MINPFRHTLSTLLGFNPQSPMPDFLSTRNVAIRATEAISWKRPLGFLILGLLAPIHSEAVGQSPDSATLPDDFSHTVAPILKKHCIACHAADQQKGGFSLNTRETLLRGSESLNVDAIRATDDSASKSAAISQAIGAILLERISSEDLDIRMPPEGQGLSSEEKQAISRWISEGLPWETGFSFGKQIYDPPLRPRTPVIPAPTSPDRAHVVDRILDAQRTASGLQILQVVDDHTFVRRAYLDLIGLLPTSAETENFLTSNEVDKREKLIAELLARDVELTEHWLTFWNDLLRNDYSGTGFITGGRTQITTWLYDALVTNKPYDQMVRELIAPPSAQSAGFANGIKWRGEVSAGQTVEIQFAQSIGQAFLGINLKCASCHDSFIDRWTLKDAYGIAAVYANTPLTIHRCDKSIGQQAQAAWIYPELGQINPDAPQPERLQQLAKLMTDEQNGRFTRTIVNRIWHRLMGHGIVHPTDAMETQPWNEDLLDALANEFVQNKYDLRKLIASIATSKAYQSQSERMADRKDGADYTYQGPRPRRLSAEQFVDAVWQLTGAAPTKFDAQVLRSAPLPPTRKNSPSTTFEKFDRSKAATWIWSPSAQNPGGPDANETVVFRKIFELKSPANKTVKKSAGAITCDNSYKLWINGNLVAQDTNWENVESFQATDLLRLGENEILIEAKNAGNGPNPAALFFELLIDGIDQGDHSNEDDPSNEKANLRIVSSTDWQCLVGTLQSPAQLDRAASPWIAPVQAAGPWEARLRDEITRLLSEAIQGEVKMVRASLVKADFLMRSLGRPNRDQIVTLRPTELTTLEAMDLSNGQTLAQWLRFGAQKIIREIESNEILAQNEESTSRVNPLGSNPTAVNAKASGNPIRERWRTTWIEPMFLQALARLPNNSELDAIYDSIGDSLETEDVEDLLWSLVMLPEFQYIR